MSRKIKEERKDFAESSMFSFLILLSPPPHTPNTNSKSQFSIVSFWPSHITYKPFVIANPLQYKSNAAQMPVNDLRWAMVMSVKYEK